MSIIELSWLGQDLFDFSDLTWAHPLTHPWVGVSTQIINLKQNWIISIRSRFNQYLVMTWPHPLTHWTTHPPNHPCTHPWVGVSLQIINLQTELNYLCCVKIYYIVSDLTWPHPLTHWPTKPPMHPPMGEGVSTNHKSSNRIESSQLGQDL